MNIQKDLTKREDDGVTDQRDAEAGRMRADPEAMPRALRAFAHITHGVRIVDGCELCATVTRCDSVDYAGPAMFGEEPAELRCELRAGHPGPHRVEWE